MQRVEIFTTEAVFKLWYLEEIKTLELDVGLWEGLAPLRLVFGQKLQRGIL